jgi:hypothetical protein
MPEKMLVIRATSPHGDIIEYERLQTLEEWFSEYRVYKLIYLEKQFWKWYIPRANKYKNFDNPGRYPWRPEGFWRKLEQLMMDGVIWTGATGTPTAGTPADPEEVI